MSDLTLYGGGDSWEDRNDSEERQQCTFCHASVGLYELGVTVLSEGRVACAACGVEADLEMQRENSSEVWRDVSEV